jgi:tetratricopeptide (TPR) repeat protein
MGPSTFALTLFFVATTATPASTLQAGIKAYKRLDDDKAIAAFQEVLASNPPSELAARAHLYLGLIAFNAIHPDEAREEFKKALEANSAIEVPKGTSPKAQLAFAEARRALTRELATPDVPAPTAPQANPTPISQQPPPDPVVGPPLVVAEPPATSSSSHILAFTLGGVAVACAVVAIVGGIQVANYNSLAAQANKDPGSVPGSSLVSSQGSANFWRIGWIAFAVAGAGSATAGVLTW